MEPQLIDYYNKSYFVVSTIDRLNIEYDELQKKYDELHKMCIFNKYDELQKKYDELQKKYDELTILDNPPHVKVNSVN